MSTDRDQPLDQTDQSRLFGQFLAMARVAAGLTQKELADRTGFSYSQVGKVEQGDRWPSGQFATACDAVLSKGRHLFERLQHAISQPVTMDASAWFDMWRQAEEGARVLRYWESMVLPGPVQTDAYAEAILAQEPGVTPAQIEQRAAWRSLRRRVVTRRDSNPPEVSVLLDEGVLSRPVGGPKVMREQLVYVLDLAALPNFTFRMLPRKVGAHCALDGAFAVAEGELDAVYFETIMSGMTGTGTDDVLSAVRRYDRAGSEALTGSETRLEIQRLLEEDYSDGTE